MPGTLTLVGQGLFDEEDITLRGLAAVRRAHRVFAERYTSFLLGTSHERLEDAYGKKIALLHREAVEDGTVILDACAKGDVVLLVAGDALTATTHTALRLQAAERGIPTRVVHNASVKTAVPGLLGLNDYKFGRTTTLVFPEKGHEPESPLEVVIENLERGLHTLVLLDIRAEERRYMTATEGLTLLLKWAAKRKDCPFGPERLVCVVARAGGPEPILATGPAGELAKRDFGPPLHAVVVPGALHFSEEDALRAFAGLAS